MKNGHISIGFLFLIMLIVSFVACASVPKKETTREYIGVLGDNYHFPNAGWGQPPAVTRIMNF
jgi:hypothetical protein